MTMLVVALLTGLQGQPTAQQGDHDHSTGGEVEPDGHARHIRTVLFYEPQYSTRIPSKLCADL